MLCFEQDHWTDILTEKNTIVSFQIIDWIDLSTSFLEWNTVLSNQQGVEFD